MYVYVIFFTALTPLIALMISKAVFPSSSPFLLLQQVSLSLAAGTHRIKKKDTGKGGFLFHNGCWLCFYYGGTFLFHRKTAQQFRLLLS